LLTLSRWWELIVKWYEKGIGNYIDINPFETVGQKLKVFTFDSVKEHIMI
jgi:hypothetical protein